MLTLVIGDIHGRGFNVEFVYRFIHLFDKVIFIGDYFDSFDIEDEDIMKTFQEIIYLKQMYPDTVTLLLGNHDLSYIHGPNKFGCSGFRTSMFVGAGNMFHQYEDFFQMAIMHDEWLFTHAGVSNFWLKAHNENYAELPLDEQINGIYRDNPEAFMFAGRNPYGDNVTQSPIWIREKSLQNDPAFVFQVVGHTQKSTPRMVATESGKSVLLMVDSPDYVTVMDGDKFYPIKVNDNWPSK